MTKSETPKNQPAHFDESIYFPAVEFIAPAGSNYLGFTRMESKQFEQFCWFLIRKDHYFEDCQYIGGNGTKQDGIDLFARDKFDSSQLIVFECKCWKKITSTKLKEAVTRFLNGNWSKSKPKFILIVAQEELGKVSETWAEQKKILSKHEIKSELWTGLVLAEKIQHFPDIVTRFFTSTTTQKVCHDWMRKVRFDDRLHYAHSHKDQEIREIAEEFMRDAETGEILDIEKFKPENAQNANIDKVGEEFKQQLINLVNHGNFKANELAAEILKIVSQNEVLESQKSPNFKEVSAAKEIEKEEKSERIFDNDVNWTIDHPAVYIHCLKPGKRMYPTSILIKFRQENASGVDVTLRQKWLLENMLGAEGTPADHRYRPFIVGELNPESTQHTIIQMQNCRLYPPTILMGEICKVVDKLSQAVTFALLKLEKDWDAIDFPFVQTGSTTYVAVCTMPKWLWNLTLKFCNEHDVSKGSTEWHIFDQSNHSLKVFTNKVHPDFDLGFHGIFYARDDLDGANYGDSIAVMWQPPDSFEKYAVSARKWMSCDFAFGWLTGKLLPKVKEWLLEKEVSEHGIFKKVAAKKNFNDAWDQRVEIGDLRQFPLLRNERYWKVGLVGTVEQLQHSVDTHGREIYLTPENVKNLYEALIVVLKFKHGYTSYIASNLNIRDPIGTHEDIITVLRNRIDRNDLALNMLSLRYMLSAYLEAFNDNDDFLSMGNKAIVFQAMIPIMADWDKRQFFQRHMKWVE